MSRICWRDMSLAGNMLQSGCVARGEHIRLILPEESQQAWLQRLTPEQSPVTDEKAWQIWLETDAASLQAGTPLFLRQVGIMLHQRGAMANLSLRENLLLPFLYHAEPKALSQAEKVLPKVVGFLGITDALDRQAGECPPHTHRLISLGRCLLQRPAIIVAQDVHTGIALEHLPRFRSLFVKAIKGLQSGLLYLSSSEQESWGIDFDRSLGGLS